MVMRVPASLKMGWCLENQRLLLRESYRLRRHMRTKLLLFLIAVLVVIAGDCPAQDWDFSNLEEGSDIVIAGRVVDLELVTISKDGRCRSAAGFCEVTVRVDTTLFGPHKPQWKLMSNNYLYIRDNRLGVVESASENAFWFRMNDNVLVVALHSKGRLVGDSSSRDIYSIRYARFFREDCNNLQQACLKQHGAKFDLDVDISTVAYRDLYGLVLDPAWIEEDRTLEDLIKEIHGD